MNKLKDIITPKAEGYFFPAEFYPHKSTWLSWPHNKESWPGKIESIFDSYCKFIAELTKGELVNININNLQMKEKAFQLIEQAGADMDKVEFYLHPTNDAWCRDHGPAFVINPSALEHKKAVVNWEFNQWGNKYAIGDNLDNQIPLLIAKELNLPVFNPGIIMEGGSVDFNGKGLILTTRACLLNDNRNSLLTTEQIENYLLEYYGAEEVLWIDNGIKGDDTDGHIDDIARFVNEDTILTVVEDNPEDENYEILQKNLYDLKSIRLKNGKSLNIIELPMPDPVIYNGERLPASYANFYIANHSVIVPFYNCKKDQLALEIIQSYFPDRKAIGIDSTDIVWGLGSFHCLSQQEPAI